MKVDCRYYCFGCGCTGDVIDFTAHLFGLKSREAALKLADDFGNSYGKFEEDRPRQCLFAGTTNTKQFLPFDRTGARRFLVIDVDSSKAEKHLLDNEEESRAYFDQLWVEAMVIFNSCKDKGSLLKHPKEMEEQIIEYRKQFMQEDMMAGQGFAEEKAQRLFLHAFILKEL